MCASFRWQKKDDEESWDQDGTSSWRSINPDREQRGFWTGGRKVLAVVLALAVSGGVLGRVIRVDDVVRAVGTVSPLEGVPLKASLKGTVEELICREGDIVEQGQVLMKIWPEEGGLVTDLEERTLQAENAATEVLKKEKEIEILEAQEAKLREEHRILDSDASAIVNAQGKARLMHITSEQRKKELARVQALGEDQLVSGAEIELAEAALEIALAEHDAALAEVQSVEGERNLRLEQLRRDVDIVSKRLSLARVELSQRQDALAQLKGQLVTAHERMERTVVRAPSAARVVRLDLRRGDHVEPGAFLLMLAASEAVRVNAEISPKDVPYVAPGQRVEVYSRQYSSWKAGFAQGEVTEVFVSARPSQAGTAREMVPAYVMVNESPFPLHLNTTVDLRIVIGKRPLLSGGRKLPQTGQAAVVGEVEG